MVKYIFLQNILTPYRISLFDELERANFHFEVYYMRNTEGDRNWDIDQSKIKHKYYLDKNGFYKMLGRFHLHFNPRILLKLIRQKDAEFILGGSWNDPNVIFLCFLKRIGLIKNRLNFWSEANYLSIGALNDNGFKIGLRKFVFNSSKGALIIPGKMSEITFVKWGIENKTYIKFPNTIEEDAFQINEEEVLTRTNNDKPVFLITARLVERIKGILNFFNGIGFDNIRKAEFLIAGDGPDKSLIEEFIISNDLGGHIKLVGYCSTEETVELYKKANGFILPSFSDSSPLTLVEAIAMKLPVLLSDRCGNHYEAVIDGENGCLFDPSDAQSIKTAFETFLAKKTEWQKMGEVSERLYSNIFKRKTVVENFQKQLITFSGKG